MLQHPGVTSNPEQQALLQALIDSIPDLIFYKDQQSVYIGCNSAFEGFVGTDKKSIIGKTDLDLFPQDVAEFFREKDRQMLTSGEARRNEEWVDFPDGSKALLDTLKTPYYSANDELLGLIGVSRDITDLHANRERLAHSLSLQQATLESTADGILVVGKNGQWQSYNQKFLEMWQIPPSISSSGDDSVAVNHVLDQLQFPDAFVQKITDLYATPKVTSFDEIPFKDGRVYERFSIPQILDENVVGRVWSFRDATARKYAELFAERHAKILEMIATGHSASTIYDAIALMYEARHPGMRCSLLELKDNKLMHGGAPSLPKEYCDAINGLVNGPSVGSCGTSTYTGKRVLVENIETDPKWAEIKDAALPHGMRCCWSEPIINSQGKVLGAFGMYYNHTALPDENELADLESAARLAGIIMERDQWETELRQSDLRFRTLFDMSPDPAWIIDKHHFVECNNAAATLLGYSDKNDLLDTHPSELSPKYQPDGELSYNKAEDMMNTAVEKGLHRFEWVHTRKDGSNFFAEVTLSAITLQERPVIYCAWRDITERIETEAENARLQRELQQAHKMESLGHLSGGIAHDFNNILNVITGYTGLALKKLTVKGESKLIGYLEHVNNASQRATDLVSKLLSFSRMDQVESLPMVLAPILKEDINMIRATLPSTIELDIEIEEDLPAVMMNPTQLQQLVMNLCVNARDAMDGQGEISIRLGWAKNLNTESPILHKPIKGDWVKLAITDSGCGIAPEIFKDLFTPFFTTKDVGKGTGLGLSVVYGIMEKNGGHILIDSEIGKGATLSLLFSPVDKAVLQVDDKTSGVTCLPSGHGETILVVDDEKGITSLLSEMLINNGYQAVASSDGIEALELFKTDPEKFSMLITDQTMPKLTGIQLITQLRMIQPDLPVILCTGYSDKINADEAESKGIQFFKKPVDYDKLIQKVTLMLNTG